MTRLKTIITLVTVVMMNLVWLPACSSSSNGGDEPGKNSLTFAPTSLTFAPTDASPKTIAVIKTGNYLIRSTASWCTVTDNGDGEYTVSVENNTSETPRSCEINGFLDGVKSESKVSVTQEGFKPQVTPTPVRPDNAASPLGIGWNLGNQMDAYNNNVAGETAWGNAKATQATFNAIKAAGFESVRIPVTWLGKVGDAPDYAIDAAWLDRVAELVGYAEAAGLKAIVNIHHDGADSKHWLDIKNAATNSSVNANVEAQLKAMWSQIAAKFADKGDFLYFESMNEIHDGGWGWGDNRKDGGKQYKTFNGWQQVFVDAVRSAGGNNRQRWLIVPTYCTNIDLGDQLTLPTDPSGKLIVAVHLYEPYTYTLETQQNEWGHTAAANAAPQSDERTLVAEFDKIVNKWLQKGIPAYIGEYGCVHRASERAENFRKYYLEYFCKAAADRNIPIVYWDNGATGAGRECGGLFNHATGAPINNGAEIARIMTEAYHNTSADYTLESVYQNAPK